MRLSKFACWALFLSLLVMEGVCSAATIRVGTARVDITPQLEMKAPLGGYGERMNRPATGVHDPILAKASRCFILTAPKEINPRLAVPAKGMTAGSGPNYMAVNMVCKPWTCGYEASVSFYGPTLGELMVKESIAGANSLKKQPFMPRSSFCSLGGV